MADEKKIVEGCHFYFDTPDARASGWERGCLGVVTDTRFVGCVWPSLDYPVALFADGSSGIEVQGPPTPRNVIFPLDTVFLNTRCDDGSANGDGTRTRCWRETETQTKADCFFTRRIEKQIVKEMQQVTEEHPIDGVLQVVTYWKEIEVERDVEIVTDLTPEEASVMQR